MKSLIIILVLLALPFAYAESLIFSGKVITGSDKAIDGGTFRFTYDEDSRKAFVSTPSGGLIVDNGACKPNSIFRVCINSANFSHKNITTYAYYYEIDATIYKLTGSLSAGGKISLESLLQNEPAELTATITNPTNFDIKNIVFSYNLANFSVIEAKGCELKDNILQWKGSLQSGYDKVCTAKISADKEGKYSLFGNLTYFNGFEAEKKTTDALAITILPKQLRVNQLIDRDIEVKNPFYLNISLQNTHTSEEISGLSTITLPSHVSLIRDTPVFGKEAKVLKRGLALKPGAGINYSFYMEKTSNGQQPISLSFEYVIKGMKEEIENITFVDVAVPEPQIKASEPETRQKSDETGETANATTASDAKIGAAIENKTAEIKTENKTAGQITPENIKKPNLFSKNILLLAISVLVAFLIALIAIFRLKKGKKEG